MAKIPIKIRICDKNYPLNVEPEQEEQVRKAEKILNKKIENYQLQYKINNVQEVTSMVAFDCIVENIRKDDHSNQLDDFIVRELKKINHLISHAV